MEGLQVTIMPEEILHELLHPGAAVAAVVSFAYNHTVTFGNSSAHSLLVLRPCFITCVSHGDEQDPSPLSLSAGSPCLEQAARHPSEHSCAAEHTQQLKTFLRCVAGWQGADHH